MTSERQNKLLDLVLHYNQLLRADTVDMTNEERVFFLDSLVTAIGAANEVFKKAVAEGNGDKT